MRSPVEKSPSNTWSVDRIIRFPMTPPPRAGTGPHEVAPRCSGLPPRPRVAGVIDPQNAVAPFHGVGAYDAKRVADRLAGGVSIATAADIRARLIFVAHALLPSRPWAGSCGS